MNIKEFFEITNINEDNNALPSFYMQDIAVGKNLERVRDLLCTLDEFKECDEIIIMKMPLMHDQLDDMFDNFEEYRVKGMRKVMVRGVFEKIVNPAGVELTLDYKII